MEVQLHNRDCLEVMAEMPDQSIDLIATDPPYYRVKKDAWDNQWSSQEEFLQWMEACVVEFARLLKPTGSMYLFSGPRLASTVEMIINRHLQVENHIVWYKPSGMHKRQNKASLRRYFPASERIIFAVSKALSESKAQHKAIAEACAPLIDYLREALKQSGLTQSEVDRNLETHMAGHWFGRSQWRLPSKEHYQALQRLLNGRLSRSYEDVKAEYERLVSAASRPVRRPFDVSGSEWYIDVWNCQPVQYYPRKHPCAKPLPLMEHIITSSSLPGQLVFDPFMGGASSGLAALNTDRRYIGCEQDQVYYKGACKLLHSINGAKCQGNQS